MKNQNIKTGSRKNDIKMVEWALDFLESSSKDFWAVVVFVVVVVFIVVEGNAVVDVVDNVVDEFWENRDASGAVDWFGKGFCVNVALWLTFSKWFLTKVEEKMLQS